MRKSHTFRLPEELIERARDAFTWLDEASRRKAAAGKKGASRKIVTLQSIVETGLERELARLEKKHGKFPKRKRSQRKLPPGPPRA